MKRLLPSTLFLLTAVSASAQTAYNWAGTTDTSWQTSTNWGTNGQPAFNSTVNGRLNVLNGANNTLVYTAAEGTTIFNGGAGQRGLVIGSSGTGAMTITGGSFSTVGSTTGDIIGNVGTGSLTINGGSYTASAAVALSLGVSGTGTFTVTSGSATLQGGLLMGNATGTATSTVNLDGGTLSSALVTGNAGGTKTFNFNGGTLAATLNNATYMSGLTTANVKAGGAKIDTSTFNITVSQVLGHDATLGTTADGGLTKSGSGALTLSGANTYTGATTVSAGTLTISNALALQNSALDTTNSVTGASAAGLKTTVTTLTLGGLTGNKNLASVFTTTSGGYSSVTALTLNPGTGVTNTYSGVIANGASGMTLTKTGLGTQTLSAANSYTGGTTVNAGTLNLGIANAINNSATNAITLGGGTLQSNFSQSLSAVTLSLTAGTANILDLSTAGTFVFADSSSATWGAGSTLSITGTFTNTSVQFGSSNLALTSVQLSQITINGLAAGIDSNGFLTSAIPEPSTYAAILGVVSIGFVIARRRRSSPLTTN